MNGASSASFTTACTITSSKCLPARRRAGPSAARKACDAARKDRAGNSRRGPIPFSRYMELCLYDPELGYYSRNTEQFGKAGDFYTSSDVHAVYGRLLARQFEEMWRMLGSPEQIEILELGPGRGLFAQDVLDWSEKKFPAFFEALHYSLAESSPALRQRLRNYIGQTNRGREGVGMSNLRGSSQNSFRGISRRAKGPAPPNPECFRSLFRRAGRRVCQCQRQKDFTL